MPRELPHLFAELCPLASLAQRALAIAEKLRQPAYACFYLTLAEAKDAKVVTADRRFAQRLAGTPWQARTMTLWSLSSLGNAYDIIGQPSGRDQALVPGRWYAPEQQLGEAVPSKLPTQRLPSGQYE